jgi:hypothetical protein
MSQGKGVLQMKKDKKWNGMFLTVMLAVTLVFGLVLAGCEVEVTDPPAADITYTVEANGTEGWSDTTFLTFTFSKYVSDLQADNVTVTNGTGAVVKGVLTSNSGESINLAINSVTTAGTVSVSIAKSGIESGAKTVTVHKDTSVSATNVTQVDGVDGSADSTAIEFDLTAAVSDLTADQITLTDGTGAAVKGALSQRAPSTDGTKWSLELTSVTTPGTVKLSSTHPRIYMNETVTVYKAGTTIPIPDGTTRALAIPLAADQWEDGTVYSTVYDPNNDEVWYRVSVTSGTAYYIWWNDSYQGNNTKTADIKVEGYRDSNTSYTFSAVDNGWTSPKDYTAAGTGTLYLKVITYSDSSTSTGSMGNRGGTFGIVFSTSNSRPSIPTPDFVASTDDSTANSVLTLGLVGTNVSSSNSTVATAEIVAGKIKITSVSQGSATITVTESSTGHTATIPVSVSAAGSITIGTITKYVPDATQSNAIELTAGTWEEGELTASSSVQWYKITVPAATTYYVYGDDYYSSNNGVTSDIRVTAYAADGVTVLADCDAKDIGNSSVYGTISVSGGGVVYLKVIPYSSSSSTLGTYAIVCATSSTTKPAASYLATPLTANTFKYVTCENSRSHWFSYSVTSDVTYTLTRDTAFPLTPYVYVYKADGTGIASDSLSSSLTFTPNFTGTAYFQASVSSDYGSGKAFGIKITP